MVPSPALVQTQISPTPSNSLDTSGQTTPMPSQCCNAQEEQAYIDTLLQLNGYIEPLCRAADKMKNEGLFFRIFSVVYYILYTYK